jgi:O-antigen/teichoic acid export membrane protein
MHFSLILKQNILGKLFNHLVVFIINILLVRILGAQLSGHFFNELYAINFIAFLCSIGLDYAAISWISREPGLLHIVRRELLSVFLFFVLTATFVLLFLLPSYPSLSIQPVWAILLFSCGNVMLILFQGILSALKKFNRQNYILIFSNLLFLLYLIMRWSSKPSIEEIAMVYAVLFSMQGLLMLFSAFQVSTEVGEGSINKISFYKYGFQVMISSLVYFVFLRVDNYYVERYCTSVELSNYVQCGKVGQYFIYFSSVISSTLLPFIASEKMGNTFKEWVKLVKPYFIMIIAGAVILITIGSLLYPFVFGEEFKTMDGLMKILLPGYVGLGVLTLVNSIYLAKGNIKAIFIGDFAGMVLVWLLDAIFVPQYGMYAAALISSVAYLLLCFYLLFNLKKQFLLP